MSRKKMSSETKSWLILHGFFFLLGFIAMVSVKGVHVGVYIGRLFSTSHLLRDVVIGGLTALICLVVLELVTWLVHEDIPPEIQRWMTEIGPIQGYSIMALTSIGEEWMFRGAVQGLLTLWLGFIPAILLTSIVFTLLHIQAMKGVPIQLVTTGILSILLGVLFYTTGSLYAPIVLHAVVNVADVWFNRKKYFSYSVA